MPLMSGPVLSVDTAYDHDLKFLADGRANMYRGLGGQFPITTLGQTAADRTRVLRTLARGDDSSTPYRAVVVSSHGEPSVVLDDDSPDGVLLSSDFEEAELSRWARSPAAGRMLYFCCCLTANGPLFDRLMELGARAVIGFACKPAWSSGEGRVIWRDFDLEIVRSILSSQGPAALWRVRDHYLDRIGATQATAGPSYRTDLDGMQKTLETMVIRG